MKNKGFIDIFTVGNSVFGVKKKQLVRFRNDADQDIKAWTAEELAKSGTFAFHFRTPDGVGIAVDTPATDHQFFIVTEEKMTPFRNFKHGIRDVAAVATRDDTWFTYDRSHLRLIEKDREKTIELTGVEANEQRIAWLLPLSNGRIAVGTRAKGIHIFSDTGELINIIPPEVAKDSIQSAFVSSQDHLWLPWHGGINRVGLGGEEEFWKLNIAGQINSLAEFQNHLVIGTSSGLYTARLSPDSNRIVSEFRLREDSSFNVTMCVNSGSHLLLSSAKGFGTIENIETFSEPLFTGPSFFCHSVFHGANPNVAYVGYGAMTSSKPRPLQRYEFDGAKWMESKTYSDSLYVRKPCEDSTGNLWFAAQQNDTGKKNETTQRLRLPDDEIDTFDDVSFPFVVGQNVYAFEKRINASWIRRFSPEQNRFIEADDMAAAMRGIEPDQSSSVFRWAASFSDNSALLSSNTAPGLYLQENTEGITVQQVLPANISRSAIAATKTNQGTIWIATRDNKLTRWRETEAKSTDKIQYQVVISDVSTDQPEPLQFSTETHSFRMPWSRSKIRIEFGVPFARENEEVIYRVRTANLVDQWSNWSRDAFLEYQGIREGNYHLEIEALADGHIAKPVQLSFTILPPWYRSWKLYLPLILFSMCIAAGITWWLLAWQRRILRERELESLVVERTQQIRQLMKDTIETEERERSRIARELHDQLGGKLTGIKFIAEQLASNLENENKPQADSAKRIRDEVTSTIPEVRQICSQLRPAILEHRSLVDSIQWLADDFSIKYKIPCELVVDDSFPRQPDEIDERDIAMYRIAQELLTNVNRHAQATQVDLALKMERETASCVLVVADNGIGIGNRHLPENTDHLGLRGIRERVSILNGKVRIENNHPGTRITVAIPKK